MLHSFGGCCSFEISVIRVRSLALAGPPACRMSGSVRLNNLAESAWAAWARLWAIAVVPIGGWYSKKEPCFGSESLEGCVERRNSPLTSRAKAMTTLGPTPGVLTFL